MKMNYKKTITMGIAAAAAMAMTAHASTIVEWGESGGDSSIATGNANGTYGTTYTSSYVSPADGTSGYDTSVVGQTREYYGAMDATGGPFGAVSAGYIQMVHNFSGAGGTLASMIAWESPDFMTSDRALESFNMEFDTRGGTTIGSYLMETADGWYISNEALAGGYATTNTKAIGGLTWSSFSLFGVSGGGAVPADTSNAVSVGAYFTSTLASGNWTGAKLQYFEVTAVPEPSSAALLGLGGLALILRRRK